MAKRYTIVIIPNLTGESKKFSISGRIVNSLILMMFFVIVASVYFTHRHIKLSREVVELEDLRMETKKQRLKIKKFSQKVKEFGLVMNKINLFDKKLRVITSLEGNEQNTSKYAIGGSVNVPLFESFQQFGKNENSNLMGKLEKELERMKEQASFQVISLQEIDTFFKEQASLLSSTPSIWPVRGWVTSGFGYRTSPFTGRKEMHEGIDIATRNGSPVISPAEGVVVRTGKNSSYGLLLEIDHGYGVVTRYGHNSKLEVSVGNKVARGQRIALVGNSGRSTGPHLHYEVLLNGVPVNPFRYILNEG